MALNIRIVKKSSQPGELSRQVCHDGFFEKRTLLTIVIAYLPSYLPQIMRLLQSR
jgi:hypothetical protein